jgi:Periplasmic binding protein
MAGPGGGRLGRPWRRFRRRPVGVQIATGAAVVVVVVVLVVVIALSGSSGSGSGGPTSSTTAASSRITPPGQASTSAAGVTDHTITVVFPVANLGALAGSLGFATDVEFSEQAKAINLFVRHINDHGGIHGRTIKADVVNYDPTDETEMRALCKQWTEGSSPVFAVLDGMGSWSGDDQLCITQEGHTPLLSQWTTVTDWTDKGSPYLWWTGPDDAAILDATVQWGLHAGLIGHDRKLGIVAGDRASDQLALNDYLLPDLKRVGITPVVKTIDADPSESATTGTQAPLVVQQMRSAGVTSVLPLVPFNVFFPVLQAETQQNWYPKLLLSDYENSIQSALGLIPVPYEKALDGQEGLTTETLGGVDDPRPESEGGYDPGVRACWTIWHKAYPQIPRGNMNDDIEEQGPVQAWCQQIRLFDRAATDAGRDLNRRTFVEAMSRIKDFPGGFAPVLSYGPDRFSGPTQYRIVRLHTNLPPSGQCRKPIDHLPPQVVCWVPTTTWQPLPGSP